MSSNSTNTTTLIEVFRQGTEHFENIARNPETQWSTNLNSTFDDPRKLHNAYARNLFICYSSKFADLSSALLLAVERSNFLTYALCGRALIETTAILRYYVVEKYKPLLDRGHLTNDDLRRLIEIDDQHLRGGRFDWQSFLLRNYTKLREDAIAKSEGKRKGAAFSNMPSQARIGRDCLSSWTKETPAVSIVYDLFCDLVHPNIGSTFLVASTDDNGLHFSRFQGEPIGKAIFEQSFPMLIAVTHKVFGVYLGQLIATIWQDDELPGSN